MKASIEALMNNLRRGGAAQVCSNAGPAAISLMWAVQLTGSSSSGGSVKLSLRQKRAQAQMTGSIRHTNKMTANRDSNYVETVRGVDVTMAAD